MRLQLRALGLLGLQPGLRQVLPVFQLVRAVLVLCLCEFFLAGEQQVALLAELAWLSPPPPLPSLPWAGGGARAGQTPSQGKVG